MPRSCGDALGFGALVALARARAGAFRLAEPANEDHPRTIDELPARLLCALRRALGPGP